MIQGLGLFCLFERNKDWNLSTLLVLAQLYGRKYKKKILWHHWMSQLLPVMLSLITLLMTVKFTPEVETGEDPSATRNFLTFDLIKVHKVLKVHSVLSGGI